MGIIGESLKKEKDLAKLPASVSSTGLAPVSLGLSESDSSSQLSLPEKLISARLTKTDQRINQRVIELAGEKLSEEENLSAIIKKITELEHDPKLRNELFQDLSTLANLRYRWGYASLVCAKEETTPELKNEFKQIKEKYKIIWDKLSQSENAQLLDLEKLDKNLQEIHQRAVMDWGNDLQSAKNNSRIKSELEQREFISKQTLADRVISFFIERKKEVGAVVELVDDFFIGGVKQLKIGFAAYQRGESFSEIRHQMKDEGARYITENISTYKIAFGESAFKSLEDLAKMSDWQLASESFFALRTMEAVSGTIMNGFVMAKDELVFGSMNLFGAGINFSEFKDLQETDQNLKWINRTINLAIVLRVKLKKLIVPLLMGGGSAFAEELLKEKDRSMVSFLDNTLEQATGCYVFGASLNKATQLGVKSLNLVAKPLNRGLGLVDDLILPKTQTGLLQNKWSDVSLKLKNTLSAKSITKFGDTVRNAVDMGDGFGDFGKAGAAFFDEVESGGGISALTDLENGKARRRAFARSVQLGVASLDMYDVPLVHGKNDIVEQILNPPDNNIAAKHPITLMPRNFSEVICNVESESDVIRKTLSTVMAEGFAEAFNNFLTKLHQPITDVTELFVLAFSSDLLCILVKTFFDHSEIKYEEERVCVRNLEPRFDIEGAEEIEVTVLKVIEFKDNELFNKASNLSKRNSGKGVTYCPLINSEGLEAYFLQSSLEIVLPVNLNSFSTYISNNEAFFHEYLHLRIGILDSLGFNFPMYWQFLYLDNKQKNTEPSYQTSSGNKVKLPYHGNCRFDEIVAYSLQIEKLFKRFSENTSIKLAELDQLKISNIKDCIAVLLSIVVDTKTAISALLNDLVPESENRRMEIQHPSFFQQFSGQNKGAHTVVGLIFNNLFFSLQLFPNFEYSLLTESENAAEYRERFLIIAKKKMQKIVDFCKKAEDLIKVLSSRAELVSNLLEGADNESKNLIETEEYLSTLKILEELKKLIFSELLTEEGSAETLKPEFKDLEIINDLRDQPLKKILIAEANVEIWLEFSQEANSPIIYCQNISDLRLLFTLIRAKELLRRSDPNVSFQEKKDCLVKVEENAREESATIHGFFDRRINMIVVAKLSDSPTEDEILFQQSVIEHERVHLLGKNEVSALETQRDFIISESKGEKDLLLEPETGILRIVPTKDADSYYQTLGMDFNTTVEQFVTKVQIDSEILQPMASADQKAPDLPPAFNFSHELTPGRQGFGMINGVLSKAATPYYEQLVIRLSFDQFQFCEDAVRNGKRVRMLANALVRLKDHSYLERLGFVTEDEAWAFLTYHDVRLDSLVERIRAEECAYQERLDEKGNRVFSDNNIDELLYKKFVPISLVDRIMTNGFSKTHAMAIIDLRANPLGETIKIVEIRDRLIEKFHLNLTEANTFAIKLKDPDADLPQLIKVVDELVDVEKISQTAARRAVFNWTNYQKEWDDRKDFIQRLTNQGLPRSLVVKFALYNKNYEAEWARRESVMKELIDDLHVTPKQANYLVLIWPDAKTKLITIRDNIKKLEDQFKLKPAFAYTISLQWSDPVTTWEKLIPIRDVLMEKENLSLTDANECVARFSEENIKHKLNPQIVDAIKQLGYSDTDVLYFCLRYKYPLPRARSLVQVREKLRAEGLTNTLIGDEKLLSILFIKDLNEIKRRINEIFVIEGVSLDSILNPLKQYTEMREARTKRSKAKKPS